MPTGYTAEVADGKVTDFRTFALRCARAFGATIMQRDDPSADPPKRREPSDYAAKRLVEDRARLAEVNAMTVEQAEAAATAEYEKAMADEEKYAANRRATRSRYEAMLAKVVLWEPPTADHVGLKKFMEEQIRESISFDCAEYPSRLQRLNGRDWLEREQKRLVESIGRNAQSQAEEEARCAGANAWIDALYASLDTPAAVASR